MLNIDVYLAIERHLDYCTNICYKTFLQTFLCRFITRTCLQFVMLLESLLPQLIYKEQGLGLPLHRGLLDFQYRFLSTLF